MTDDVRIADLLAHALATTRPVDQVVLPRHLVDRLHREMGELTRRAERAEAQLPIRPDGTHAYYSCGCLHENMTLPDGRTGHEYCEGETGACGTKIPATCKHCGAPCACPNHRNQDAVPALVAGVATSEEPEPDPFSAVFMRQGPDGERQWLWRCDGVRHCPGDIAVGFPTDDAAADDYRKHAAEKHRAKPTPGQLHARCQHPGWEYATTEGPRKQWDRIDEPPHDEHGDPDPTWERNVDAGRDGWERFDYTEESYWRRPKQAEGGQR